MHVVVKLGSDCGKEQHETELFHLEAAKLGPILFVSFLLREYGIPVIGRDRDEISVSVSHLFGLKSLTSVSARFKFLLSSVQVVPSYSYLYCFDKVKINKSVETVV